MRKGLKRILTMTLVGAMMFSLAACGERQGAEAEESSGVSAPEWVYVPEYLELDENGSYWSAKQSGDYLYYEENKWDETTGQSSSSIVKYALTDGSRENIAIDTQGGSLNSFEIGEDGSVYAVIYIWSINDATGEYDSWEELVKYDPAGKEVYRVDLSELKKEEGLEYIGSMAVDEQGRLYVNSDAKIALFDEEGTYSGVISLGDGMSSWVQGMGRGRDGRVYASCHVNSGTGSGYELYALDFDGKSKGETYENFSGGNGNGLSAGVEKDFLTHDGSSVYEYDMATQTKEKLFDWLDSDINGQYVNGIGVTDDGKILAIINDWNTGEYSAAVLTKTPGSEVVQKETLVIGVMGSSQELMAAAVNFNKTNEKYRVTIKDYVDHDNWTENTWSDAITRLNNDIVSENCPDIVDLTNLNVQQLVAQGVFADIMPYLEQSTVLNREDYLENVLKGFTFGETLVGIPKSFYISTVAGSAEELGEEPGWSLEEMIAYADKHPEASLFDNASKANIMSWCLMYNENAFVDWSTGKCNFNTPEFISLLEFANRFPDEGDYDSETSTPMKIQNGEVLLDNAYLSGFDDIQMSDEIFGGKACFIGYPTLDGSVGCAMSASDVYGITEKSRQKDGAWAFIESYLATADTDRWSYGFPSNEKQLEAKLEEAVKVETYTWVDENGVEHEEAVGGSSSISYQDGWTYEYHTTTREEANRAMELIKLAKPTSTQDSEIMSIISEEAEAFYKGQKSASEVAEVIQRRAQVYVSENS